jgi:hypothetical protein
MSPSTSQPTAIQPLIGIRSSGSESQNQNLASGLFSRPENDEKLASLIVQVQAAPLSDGTKQTIINLIQEHGGNHE